jgi:GalNAc-alpha-(1->4)-GalNAc-alpha-(1->3)-diNAcBac-PP-undecaprenol alpha-1,4-N-acetyl-D-galactosaminyltransferase
MQIAIVGPCLKMGGMEAASANFANGLVSLGHAVTYISVFKKPRFFALDSAVQFIEPIGFNESSLSIFKTIIYLRKSIGINRFDAVLSIGKLYSALTVAALIGTSNKVFSSERSSPLYKWPLAQELLCRLIFNLKQPTGVIAQTSIAAQYQKVYYRGIPIQVIHNPVRDVKLFQGVEREPFVLAVGRLADPLKGFDLLVEAFAKVDAPTWKLKFAGGDKDGEHLKQIAERLGIRNRIEFLGQVKDLDELFAIASIFVIPSRSEGFPNALCEAMAAGLPCISFDFVAGPRDLIQPNVNGLLVENGDTIQLGEALQTLIEDKSLRDRLGQAAEGTRDKLALNTISTQVVNFIQASV